MGALMSTAADMGKPSQSPAINSSLRFLFIFSFPFTFAFNSSVVYFYFYVKVIFHNLKMYPTSLILREALSHFLWRDSF